MQMPNRSYLDMVCSGILPRWKLSLFFIIIFFYFNYDDECLAF